LMLYLTHGAMRYRACQSKGHNMFAFTLILAGLVCMGLAWRAVRD
jgi:hypothetical protein